MTINKLQKGGLVARTAKVLRQVAKPVPLEDIGTKKLGDIIAAMKRAMHAEEDGVAIAAPQIGESLRIFVVRGGILPKYPADRVFINPEITKASKKKHKVEEGCLSLRWFYGEVSRHEKVTLTALDEKGRVLTVGTSGLLAQIFQHEVDHLNGILFTDKAENLRDVPPVQHEEEL